MSKFSEHLNFLSCVASEIPEVREDVREILSMDYDDYIREPDVQHDREIQRLETEVKRLWKKYERTYGSLAKGPDAFLRDMQSSDHVGFFFDHMEKLRSKLVLLKSMYGHPYY